MSYSHSYSSSNRVGRSSNRIGYDSDSKITGSRNATRLTRSKSVDDTYKRSSSGYRGSSGGYRNSYTTGGYKTYTLDGDRYAGRSSGGAVSSKYISKSHDTNLSRSADIIDNKYTKAVVVGDTSKYSSKSYGGSGDTTCGVSGGGVVSNSTKYKSSTIHGQTTDGYKGGYGHARSASIGTTKITTTTTGGGGLDTSVDDNKSQYRIVGRITRSRSPSPNRKSTGISCRVAHTGADVCRVGGNGGGSGGSGGGGGGGNNGLSLPRPVIGQDSSGGRQSPYGGRYSPNGGRYSPRGRRHGRSNSADGILDMGGCSGGSGRRPYSRGRSPGRSGRSPNRRSPHRYSRNRGGSPTYDCEDPSKLPRPILKSYLSRDNPLRRSRSLNDIRSPSVRRGINPDIIFPVCSRFPNCSVCSIDIPQNQINRDQVIHTIQDELKEDSEHIAIIEKKDKEIQLKTETISQITQMLEKTKKELQVRITECNRRETEVKQLKIEMKNIINEKKKVEYSYSEQQITVSKLDATETRLTQMSTKCDELSNDNRELCERIKQLEISEREFIELERNVIELQTQLRDMEFIEVDRDELVEKLTLVQKQRDDFLQKGKLVEEERNEFVRSNKTLEQYLIEWKKKTQEFKRTNQSLKDRILSLERDKKELEERIIDIQQERTIMQTKISNLEMERDDYIRELREITLERNALEARLADYEDMLGDQDQLEEGFHSLRLKVAELTRQRDDMEMMIHSYKSKISHLKKTIHERDEKVLELSHEIKILKVSIENDTYTSRDVKITTGSTSNHHHHRDKDIKAYFTDSAPNLAPTKIYRPSDTDMSSETDSYELLPVRPNKYDTYSDESILYEKESRKRRHDRKRSKRKYVALFDYDPYKSSTSEHPERELRLREGDYVTVYGEVDIDGYLEGEVDGVTGLVPNIYVEEMSDDDRYASHHHHHKAVTTSSSNGIRYVVLYDYDPYTMGTTGRPDLQLSLRKGDVIIVFGSVNQDGYYTATLNGKRGLVPSNFVEEYSSYYSSRQTSSHHHHGNEFTQNSNFEGTIEVEEIAGPPYAPRDLKVSRVVTKNAVLLSWQLPSMDERYYSNGCRVVGYRLWVNGVFKQDIKTATTTKALLDGIDLSGRVEFSIQTIGDGDLCSEKCHFAITGALAALGDSLTEAGNNTFVALYDYDPFKSSPNPNPSLELAFREGDVLTVYDTSRRDGFYGAEINGQKGLVPSNFIERVSNAGHHHHHLSSQQESELSRRVSFKSKEA